MPPTPCPVRELPVPRPLDAGPPAGRSLGPAVSLLEAAPLLVKPGPRSVQCGCIILTGVPVFLTTKPHNRPRPALWGGEEWDGRRAQGPHCPGRGCDHVTRVRSSSPRGSVCLGALTDECPSGCCTRTFESKKLKLPWFVIRQDKTSVCRKALDWLIRAR